MNLRIFSLTVSLILIMAGQACTCRTDSLTSPPPDMAAPSYQADLVEIVKVDPTVKTDIRYASTNNFIGKKVYPEARAFLLRPAAEALLAASAELNRQGYGLIIYDAYRPWSVTLIFWNLTPPDKKQFVAVPHEGSVHNRGYAADLSLYDLKTGKELEMPSAFDEMNEKAYPDYQGGTESARRNRDLLRKIMESHGFTVHPCEWWHFNYKGWENQPVMDAPFPK